MSNQLNKPINQPKKLVIWSDKLTIGVREIDEQHRKLIDVINQLNDDMQLGKARHSMSKALKDLSAYALFHFDTEEKLMTQYQYPMAEAHYTDHKIFSKTINNFTQNVDSGRVLVCVEMMNFLRDWFFGHIMNTDKELGQALKLAGIEQERIG